MLVYNSYLCRKAILSLAIYSDQLIIPYVVFYLSKENFSILAIRVLVLACNYDQ